MSVDNRYRPEVVAHADWSSDPAKRWLTVAVRTNDSYRLAPARLCPTASTLIETLRRQSADRSVMLGFDFPVGLPRLLAQPLGVETMRAVLVRLADGAWPNFLTPAEKIEDVGAERPFFPARQMPKGLVTRQALAEALGACRYDELLRRCDHADERRRATACLFFLVGGQQVGKAAIAGWRSLILPYHDDPSVALWPFDGRLHQVLAPGRTVLCETYPGEFTKPLDLAIGRGGRSKRRQTDRRAVASALFERAAEMDLILDAALQQQIETGFGPTAQGEDAFDSLVGVLGMLSVLTGRLTEGVPEDDPDIDLEGWILGHQS